MVLGSIMFTICCKIQSIVTLLKEHYNISYNEAMEMFYKSKVYKSLENEEAKMWYFSSNALFDIFLDEKRMGNFNSG